MRMEKDEPAERFSTMVLAVLSQGNRHQDWIDVGYGEENKDEHGRYYDPKMEELHTRNGKTDNEGEMRVFRVSELSARAIALYHHANESHKKLLPFTVSDTNSHIRNVVIKKELTKMDFPYLKPTELRDLYETAIRFILNWSEEQIDRRMDEIGHSPQTAFKRYALFHGMVALLE